MTPDRVDTVIRLLADYVVKNRDTGYAWEAIGALITDAIRQAIQEEREALVSLVMNDAYAASFQTLGQYRVALKDTIRERK